jgi:hypothetical protein
MPIIFSDDFDRSTHLIKKTKYTTRCSVKSSTIYTEPHILQLHVFVFKINKTLTDQRTGVHKVAIRPIAIFATDQVE